jgi:hypothetical protein
MSDSCLTLLSNALYVRNERNSGFTDKIRHLTDHALLFYKPPIKLVKRANLILGLQNF